MAIAGYASGAGTAVEGQLAGASTTGDAVRGIVSATNTSSSSVSAGVYGGNASAPQGVGGTAAAACGVRGEATGAPGTAFTMGVYGINTASTGTGFGVYGQTNSSAGMGLFGVNLSTSATTAHAIQGQAAANGGAAAIRGLHTAPSVGPGQSAYGVRGSVGTSPTGTGFVAGVRGDAAGTSGIGYGVLGTAGSATGFGGHFTATNLAGTGLMAIGQNATGTTLAAGSGLAACGTGVGALTVAQGSTGTGLLAVGNALGGGLLSLNVGSGLAATGTQFGVAGFATTTVNTTAGTTGQASGANASAGGYFEVQAAGVAQTWTYVGVRDSTATLRKIIGPGTVNTVVTNAKGELVALSAPEAPENVFQDWGQGQLVNGRAHVALDPTLAANITVHEKHPLRVFVQLEGDCNGVFVTRKTPQGFDVVELRGGRSNTPFSWTITANRANQPNPDGTVARYADERFPLAPGPQRSAKAPSLTAPRLPPAPLEAPLPTPPSALAKASKR